MITNQINTKTYFFRKTRQTRLAFFLIGLSFFIIPLSARDKEPFAVEFEGNLLWQTRNDVRIPNETGTEFSLVDTVGKGPYGAFRAEAAFDVNKKHGFRMVIAPLKISSQVPSIMMSCLPERVLIPACLRMRPINSAPIGLPTGIVSTMVPRGGGRSVLQRLFVMHGLRFAREISMRKIPISALFPSLTFRVRRTFRIGGDFYSILKD